MTDLAQSTAVRRNSPAPDAPDEFVRTDSRLVLDPVFREITGSPYFFLAALAEGGMGRVDLAMRQVGSFRRFYAVKHLHPHLARDAGAREMFAEEGRIGGHLSHPNVVGVTDLGEDSWGPYLVMDFVEGLSLGSLMQLVIERAEVLPVEVALRIGLQIAKGLDAIHHAVDSTGQPLELVHRDLSPRNVLLGFDGSVRITDFGIAKAKNRSLQTTAGMLKGTLGYVAPERLRFEEPSPRSDLFSFGVVLYEVLAGERLYTGSASESAKQILTSAPPDIGEVRPEVPPAITDLIFRLLARDSEERPASAADVVLLLEKSLSEAEEQVELGVFLSLMAAERRQALRARIEDAVRAASSSLGATFPIANSQVIRRKGTRTRTWLAPVLLLSLAAAAMVGYWKTAEPRDAGRPGSASMPGVIAVPEAVRLGTESVAVAQDAPTEVQAAADEPSSAAGDPEGLVEDQEGPESQVAAPSLADRRRARRLAQRRLLRSQAQRASTQTAMDDSPTGNNRVLDPSSGASMASRMRNAPPQEMTWTGQFR